MRALAEAGRLRPAGRLFGYRTSDGRIYHPADVEIVYESVGPWLPVEATDTPKEP